MPAVKSSLYDQNLLHIAREDDMGGKLPYSSPSLLGGKTRILAYVDICTKSRTGKRVEIGSSLNSQ